MRYNPSDMNSRYLKLFQNKGECHPTPDIKDKVIVENLAYDKHMAKFNPYFMKKNKKVPDTTFNVDDLKAFQ